MKDELTKERKEQLSNQAEMKADEYLQRFGVTIIPEWNYIAMKEVIKDYGAEPKTIAETQYYLKQVSRYFEIYTTPGKQAGKGRPHKQYLTERLQIDIAHYAQYLFWNGDENGKALSRLQVKKRIYDDWTKDYKEGKAIAQPVSIKTIENIWKRIHPEDWKE